MSTEIDDWAYFTHTNDDRPAGGTYAAFDKSDDVKVGELSYFWLNEQRTLIQFKDVFVAPEYRRRRVATALLRHLNDRHPDARINPGQRSQAGEEFMKHILNNESNKVATNGVLDVPLFTMRPEFWSLNVEMSA